MSTRTEVEALEAAVALDPELADDYLASATSWPATVAEVIRAGRHKLTLEARRRNRHDRLEALTPTEEE
jgi:hypothetical protein